MQRLEYATAKRRDKKDIQSSAAREWLRRRRCRRAPTTTVEKIDMTAQITMMVLYDDFVSVSAVAFATKTIVTAVLPILQTAYNEARVLHQKNYEQLLVYPLY